MSVKKETTFAVTTYECFAEGQTEKHSLEQTDVALAGPQNIAQIEGYGITDSRWWKRLSMSPRASPPSAPEARPFPSLTPAGGTTTQRRRKAGPQALLVANAKNEIPADR